MAFSGVREQPDCRAQRSCFTDFNIFGHLELCPCGRSEFRIRSQDGAQTKAWSTATHHHGTHHVRPVTQGRFELGLGHTSSTWHIAELSPPRDERREVPGPGAEHEPRPGGVFSNALVDRLPQPRVPAPITAHTDRGPVTTPTPTPDSDSDSDHSIRPHPGASSFRLSPTVVHGPRELLQEFTIALRNAYHGPFTAWTQGELEAQKRQGRKAHLQDYCPLPPEDRGGSRACLEDLPAT